jgi:cytochrome c556
LIAGKVFSSQYKTRLALKEFKSRTCGIRLSLSAEQRTAKLVDVSKSGDFNARKAQFGEVAKSCKGCHEQFRIK